MNGNTVRNFPTHGQLSAAQGNLTAVFNFDFAIQNCLTHRLCTSSLIDGPEVEHGAHFLILYDPSTAAEGTRGRRWARQAPHKQPHKQPLSTPQITLSPADGRGASEAVRPVGAAREKPAGVALLGHGGRRHRSTAALHLRGRAGPAPGRGTDNTNPACEVRRGVHKVVMGSFHAHSESRIPGNWAPSSTQKSSF